MVLSVPQVVVEEDFIAVELHSEQAENEHEHLNAYWTLIVE